MLASKAWSQVSPPEPKQNGKKRINSTRLFAGLHMYAGQALIHTYSCIYTHTQQNKNVQIKTFFFIFLVFSLGTLLLSIVNH